MDNKWFVPTTDKEKQKSEIRNFDIIIVTGDAYVDHPAYEVATISRYLMHIGYKVGIIDNPDPKNPKDFKELGRPTLFFLVITGLEDSTYLHRTAFNKVRSTDPYIPEGEEKKRPERACIMYTNILKQNFKDIPVVLSGKEASLRRLPYFDFASGKVRKPIIFDAKADLIVYGNSEHNLRKVADMVRNKKPFSIFDTQPGFVTISTKKPDKKNSIHLPSFDEVSKDNDKLIEMTNILMENISPYTSKLLVMEVMGRYLLVSKPFRNYTDEETDEIFNLFYKRKPHIKYLDKLIPYYDRYVKNKIVTHRGDISGSYLSSDILSSGRLLSQRSVRSLFREVHYVSDAKDFKGSIYVTNKTPEFYRTYVKDELSCKKCRLYSCIYPNICENLKRNSEELVSTLLKIDREKLVRNNHYGSDMPFVSVFRDSNFFKDLVKNRGNVTINIFTADDDVRKLLNLYPIEHFFSFYSDYFKRKGEYSKGFSIKVEVTLGLPSENFDSVLKSALLLKEKGITVEKINYYYPTPLTPASVMYHTEKDLNKKDIYVSKKLKEKENLSILYRWDKKGNHNKIKSLLVLEGKEEYIDKLLD